MVEAHPLYEKATRDVVNGMYYDPADFLPRHMARWLEKRELEGVPLPPGCYLTKWKVRILILILYSAWSNRFASGLICLQVV